MDGLWGDLAIIFVFFLIGAVFSAAEMALVSLRESQIKALSHRGSRGKALVALTSNPNRFLSAVQIGVTLSGFLSASFGGASLANQWLTPVLVRWGMHTRVASVLALVVVTAVISFCSIVISELTAKRLAMQRAESIALTLAPVINTIATLFKPLIWALGACTNGLVRLLGGDPAAGKEAVTDEEIRDMVSSSASLGDEERRIVDEVFDAGDRNLREVMVPRTEADFLPGDMTAAQAIREIRKLSHSRYPVTDGSPDKIVGFLHVRDLMDLDPPTRSAPIKQLARPVLSLPETVKVLRALTDMRRQHSHLAIVLDEYGGTAGIVTLEDLVEELIGDITDEYDLPDAPGHDQAGDFDGLTTLEEFGDRTGLVLPEGPYDTLAGYFMAQLGEVPTPGDHIEVALLPETPDPDSDETPDPTNLEMTVTEMDGRRIAWIHVTHAG
jgi:putative hemolysin